MIVALVSHGIDCGMASGSKVKTVRYELALPETSWLTELVAALREMRVQATDCLYVTAVLDASEVTPIVWTWTY